MHRIQLTEENIQEQLEALYKKLKTGKFRETSVTLKLDTTLDKKTQLPVYIDLCKPAYQKLNALVDECSKEIAWHGIVDKIKTNEEIVYSISDIIMFPQTVTAATVTTDDTEYSNWVMQLDDETFNKLRFHGHSHVNMSTSPSGVDTDYQSALISNVEDFYIFGIFNKRDQNWLTIFDIEDNICYEDKDITLRIPVDTYHDWAVKQIKEYVKEPKPAYSGYGYNNKNNNYYKGYTQGNLADYYRSFYDDDDDSTSFTGYPATPKSNAPKKAKGKKNGQK